MCAPTSTLGPSIGGRLPAAIGQTLLTKPATPPAKPANTVLGQ